MGTTQVNHHVCYLWHLQARRILIPAIHRYEIQPILAIHADSASRVPEVNHISIVEVLWVAINYLGLNDQNWPSSDSLRNIPLLPSFLVGLWAWKYIRISEFISLETFSIRIHILSLKYSFFGQSKSPNCRPIFCVFIYLVSIDDFSIFSYEGGRYVQLHIEVSTVEHSVYDVLL